MHIDRWSRAASAINVTYLGVLCVLGVLGSIPLMATIQVVPYVLENFGGCNKGWCHSSLRGLQTGLGSLLRHRRQGVCGGALHIVTEPKSITP